MESSALIIFAKNPDDQNVKTRLAAETGAEKARKIYKALLNKTLETAAKADVTGYVFWAGSIPEFTTSFQCKTQTGSSLGIRMRNAFAEILNEHEKVLIIGSDCPEMSVEILHNALSELDSNDLVIGPASDGGYVLLGMKQLHEALFSLEKWSHSEVFSETMEIAKELGLTCAVLPQLSDIDIAEDLLHFPHLMELINSDGSQ